MIILCKHIKYACSNTKRTVLGEGVQEACDEMLPSDGYKFFKQITVLKRMSAMRLTQKTMNESNTYKRLAFSPLIKKKSSYFKIY